MKTYLNISLCLDNDQPLDQLCSEMHERLEYLLEEENCKVFSVTWDRDQALAALHSQELEPLILTKQQPLKIASEVALVLEQFNLTLPKQKKGAPAWRVPIETCFGSVEGLPSLRGRLILTNGITAYLVLDSQTNGDGKKSKWAEIHYDWFIPDKNETLPTGLNPPKGRGGKKLLEICQGFE